ncbi:expressed unknown protein [Seminavis robusta]|uniref:Uncharacterized protein n=1 Tax=Seminavis robusta TaxID=568900 RepID=A0A9N8DQT6_9STRA|nr:expressed unknown protein [Seminavis robusta]|eukprot:Sro220_g090770.1 n/a (522) ;mRNA; r:63555-65120
MAVSTRRRRKQEAASNNTQLESSPEPDAVPSAVITPEKEKQRKRKKTLKKTPAPTIVVADNGSEEGSVATDNNNIIKPTPLDVLFGCGHKANDLRKISLYPKLLDDHVMDYRAIPPTNTKAKRDYIKNHFIERIRHEGGRFLMIEPRELIDNKDSDSDDDNEYKVDNKDPLDYNYRELLPCDKKNFVEIQRKIQQALRDRMKRMTKQGLLEPRTKPGNLKKAQGEPRVSVTLATLYEQEAAAVATEPLKAKRVVTLGGDEEEEDQDMTTTMSKEQQQDEEATMEQTMKPQDEEKAELQDSVLLRDAMASSMNAFHGYMELLKDGAALDGPVVRDYLGTMTDHSNNDANSKQDASWEDDVVEAASNLDNAMMGLIHHPVDDDDSNSNKTPSSSRSGSPVWFGNNKGSTTRPDSPPLWFVGGKGSSNHHIPPDSPTPLGSLLATSSSGNNGTPRPESPAFGFGKFEAIPDSLLPMTEEFELNYGPGLPVGQDSEEEEDPDEEEMFLELLREDGAHFGFSGMMS